MVTGSSREAGRGRSPHLDGSSPGIAVGFMRREGYRLYHTSWLAVRAQVCSLAQAFSTFHIKKNCERIPSDLEMEASLTIFLPEPRKTLYRRIGHSADSEYGQDCCFVSVSEVMIIGQLRNIGPFCTVTYSPPIPWARHDRPIRR